MKRLTLYSVDTGSQQQVGNIRNRRIMYVCIVESLYKGH